MAAPAITVNEQIRDLSVGRQVGVTQYSNSLVRRVMALLNRADVDLFAQLLKSLLSKPADSFTVKRLDSLLTGVREANHAVYAKVLAETKAGLRDLTASELKFQGELLGRVPAATVALKINPVSVDQAFAAVQARPFQGKLLKDWAGSIEASRMARIREAIRMGFVQQEPIQAMVARIRGTPANGFADGLLEIDRRGAESVVRTAVSHTAAVARNAMYKANSDIVKAVQWLSTLDDKTTEICAVRDNLIYTADTHRPVGHEVPWHGGPGAAHFACRSTSTPVLRSMKEMGLDMPDMPAGKRAAMDGAVPADTTYGEWFAKQSAKRQDTIVGPVRGKLFRDGGMTYDKFSNAKGNWLTIEQLRKVDAMAFEDAGL